MCIPKGTQAHSAATQAFLEGKCVKGRDCDMYHQKPKKKTAKGALRKEGDTAAAQVEPPTETGEAKAAPEEPNPATVAPAGILPRFELMSPARAGL